MSPAFPVSLPLIRPNPPRLSELAAGLARIEASGVFTNGGPMVREFEQQATERLFGGEGACLAVCSATVGLILAIRQASLATPGRPLALMPSFTFAATAHAAVWAGLTPLLCDIDEETWLPDATSEEALLRAHAGRVGVLVPYGTFGNALDLDRYAWLSRRHEVPVVIDAASSLGTLDARGRTPGAGSAFASVYSMHATKTFATGEGGLIHSADPALIAQLRCMTNFGFEQGRSATLPGLNGKLSEVAGLLALAKLNEIDAVATHRAALVAAYERELEGDPDLEVTLQRSTGMRPGLQFMPVLLPPSLIPARAGIVARLAELGIGSGTYFSPHLAEQPWFQANALAGPLPVTERVSRRVLVLPLTDAMDVADVATVCAGLRAACLEAERAPAGRAARRGAEARVGA
jgi:dTDP-4-amino-4,6-dideoxygalactose transaminase